MTSLIRMLPIALCVTLPLGGALAQQCVTDEKRFDYLDASPQKFLMGTPEAVKGAYRQFATSATALKTGRTTQYFVEIANFAQITSRPCDGPFCEGMDTLRGLNECSQQTGQRCAPLGAVKGRTLYCVLEPAFEYNKNGRFLPFD